MINLTKLVSAFVILCLAFQSGYAMDKEVIADIGDRPLTNIEILESIAIKPHSPNYECKPYNVKYAIEDILLIILFEQYAAKNGIKITDQEVVDSLTATANMSGRTLAEYIQKSKAICENVENTKKRYYKQVYTLFLNRRVVEHYNPDVNNVSEEDIQRYIENYKKTIFAPMGTPEGIRYRGIAATADNYAKNASLREEFNIIKKRINDGESFETIAKDYANRKEEGIGVGYELSDWIRTKEFKKEGLDALVPWGTLKGKAVLVSMGQAGIMVMKIEDYMPDTRKSIEDAVNDKNLRKVVIDEARKYKFGVERRKLIEKLKTDAGGIKFRGDKKEIYQRLADQYKQFKAETNKSDPNSNRNY